MNYTGSNLFDGVGAIYGALGGALGAAGGTAAGIAIVGGKITGGAIVGGAVGGLVGGAIIGGISSLAIEDEMSVFCLRNTGTFKPVKEYNMKMILRKNDKLKNKYEEDPDRKEGETMWKYLKQYQEETPH